MSNFTIGRQPCYAFKRQHDDMGGNEHSCMARSEPLYSAARYCTGTVSFCTNCNRDHHSGGYEECDRSEHRDIIGAPCANCPPQRDARPSLESAPQLRGFAVDDNAKPHVCHEEMFMACGHHDSLRMSSVESDETWCGLCEMKSKLSDALAMERSLTIERNQVGHDMRLIQEMVCNKTCASKWDSRFPQPHSFECTTIRGTIARNAV